MSTLYTTVWEGEWTPLCSPPKKGRVVLIENRYSNNNEARLSAEYEERTIDAMGVVSTRWARVDDGVHDHLITLAVQQLVADRQTAGAPKRLEVRISEGVCMPSKPLSENHG